MSINRDEILRELTKFQVILEFDGAPDYGKLQSTLILCDNHQRKIVNYLNQVEPELSAAQNTLRNETFQIETKKRDIKTNNARVKSLPTGKERDEAAESLIEDDLKRKLVLENEINTLSAIKGSLMTTLKKLKGTEQNIKLLKTIADQQVTKLNVGTVSDPQVSELNKNLAELSALDKEISLKDEIGNTDDVENSSDIVEEAELPEGDEESISEENTMEVSTTGGLQTLPEEESTENSETISIYDLPMSDEEDLFSEEEIGAEKSTDIMSVTAKPSVSDSKAPSKAKSEETLEEFLESNPVTPLVIPGSAKKSEEIEERDISKSGSIDFDIDLGGSNDSKKSNPVVGSKKPPEVKSSSPPPGAKKVVEDKASVGPEMDILDLLNDFN
jgi:hypothetical protein